MASYEQREVVNSGFLLVYVVAFVTMGVLLGLFFGKAIEVEIYKLRASIYMGFLAIFTIGIVALGVIGAVIKKWGGNLYNSYGFLGNAVNEPEEGLLWQVKPLRKFLTSFPQQFLLGIILFSLLGLFYATQNTFLNDIPFVPQQITEFGTIISEIEPASTTETLVLMFFDGLIFSIAIWLRHRYKWGQATTFAFKLLVFPVSVAVWLMLHSFVYQGSERSLLAVGLFALITTGLYFFSGSVILPLLHHQINNLFIILNLTFSNDIIKVITLVIVLVSISLFAFLVVVQKNRKPTLEVSSGG